MASDGPRRRRCAIYTRKSTEEGLDQAFNSLDAQYEACAAYVMSQQHEGWTLLPDRYDDGGYSGGTIDRPGLTELLDAIRAGKVDVVVVYKIDRLTRSLADFARIVEVLDGQGASFVSVTQAFNTTTSMGRLTLNVLLSFAQFEREVIAERVRDKVAASKARGMWMGGLVPLGYDIGDRRLVVNPIEADIVRDIMQRYLATTSVRALVEELERDGITSKRATTRSGKVRGGQPFRHGNLVWLLSNPIYIGKIRHKDKLHDGEHQAIVEQALFDAVQQRLAAHSRRPRANLAMPSGASLREPRPRRAVSLLAGLIFDHLGRPMSPCHTNNHGRRYRYYASNLAADATAPALRLPAGELDAASRAALTAFLADGPALRRISGHLDVAELATLIAGCARLASAIDAASTDDLRDTMRALAMQVNVTPSQVTLFLPAANLFASLNVTPPPTDSIILDLPSHRTSFGQEPRLRLDPPAGPTAVRDEKLVQLIGRGFTARSRLQALTADELASLPPNAHRHLVRVARLAYLSPDIIRAILNNTQPRRMSVRGLWRMAALPLSWHEQHQALGFPAI